MKNNILPISDFSGERGLGGKIQGLADLYVAKLPIPETYYSPQVEEIHPDVFVDELKEKFRDFPIILRSSANVEDGSSRSYAGFFESFVCQNWEEVRNAFDKIQLYSQKNIRLAYPNTEDQKITMNVIIEPYLHYDFSGVFITQYRDANTGYGECVEGEPLSKLLHSGESDYQFLIEGCTTMCDFPYKDMILNHYLLVSEKFLGSYEYEWCITKEGFYFLQKRPYTLWGK